MRDYYWKVTFESGAEHVLLTSSREIARILAKAAEIKRGNSFEIVSDRRLTDGEGRTCKLTY